ncbi:hypothetical protein GCM10009086_58350 [Pseudomonas rhodesiae]
MHTPPEIKSHLLQAWIIMSGSRDAQSTNQAMVFMILGLTGHYMAGALGHPEDYQMQHNRHRRLNVGSRGDV